MKYYRDMMLGEYGAILGKDSFVKKIADTGEIFNKNYLSAEYENAYYSTIMADQWSRYADDEMLEYSTAGDSHVRASHKLLDKYTAPKADPFWKTNYPPNGWGCRCTAIPGKTKSFSERQQERFDAGKNSLKIENEKTPFYNNVGISAQIFDEKKHPYFKIFSKNEIEDVKKEVEKLTSEEIIQNQKDINLLREDDRWRKAYEDVKATDLEKKYPQLTLEELATIQHYTNMGYWDLNEALYTKRVFPLEEANERILNRALEKLPKTTELNVARGVPFDEEKYKKYADNIGKIVSHEGFTSTSTREDIAKAFGQDEPIMMFYIEHKNGRELRDISFFSETFDNDNEFEVLFKSNSKFKVKKIIPNGSDVDIYLEEVD